MSRGCYLALEGAEGAGKTTVAAALRRLLETAGTAVLVVREPGGTEVGEEIRRLLLHGGYVAPWTEALLFAAQRAQLVAEVVRPALEEGVWVVSDRSYYSSLAYQGAARGLGVEAVRAVNEVALEGTVPDLVVFLDVPAEQGLARQHEEDRIGGQGVAFQQAVSEAYRDLARREAGRVVVVPATDPPERVARRIMQLAAARGWR